MESSVGVVSSRFKELGQDVIDVACDDELFNGQAHSFGVIPCEDIAEIAARNDEVDAFARFDLSFREQIEIRGEVIHDLGHESTEVDGVRAAEFVAFFGEFFLNFLSFYSILSAI